MPAEGTFTSTYVYQERLSSRENECPSKKGVESRFKWFCRGQLWQGEKKERKKGFSGDEKNERERNSRVTDTLKFLGTMNMYYLVKWSLNQYFV